MKNGIYLVMVICMMSMSCNSSGKKNILGIDSMKVVMWDMMQADELYLRILAKDSTARKRMDNIHLYRQVLALHNVSKGQFDSSYKFYEAHPNQFKELIDSLEAFSTRKKNALVPIPGQAPLTK